MGLWGAAQALAFGGGGLGEASLRCGEGLATGRGSFT